MDAEIQVVEVKEVQSRSGNTRYVVRDADGTEYTTFRPQIGREAHRYEGRRARISYHEEERGGFHNVYLDNIAPASAETAEAAEAADEHHHGKSPDEVGWDTAVEAADWLLGAGETKKAVPPERLYDKLRPFKDLVADDIREGGDEGGDHPRDRPS
ncbi:hypothetical protein [Actinomadura rudentiformis]|uniref:Uncharacterized protein n=1 Tax=Actinomadura rudentiformis TaxID=359158 RepID=A0A6H9Z9Z6_9ACTN|nr:hypothetical protein [Actinomadura rudentiformis]KAB2352525.1 hypothetical protein F8566_02270 [Actinomadura rudentiformis]